MTEQKTTHAPEWITVSEYAREFGVHTMTVYRRIWAGKLAAITVGGTWRIDRQAVLNQTREKKG